MNEEKPKTNKTKLLTIRIDNNSYSLLLDTSRRNTRTMASQSLHYIKAGLEKDKKLTNE